MREIEEVFFAARNKSMDEHKGTEPGLAQVAGIKAVEAFFAGTARPISEYHEDMGDVLWWKFPIVEPPYVGHPNHLGFTVEAELRLRKHRKQHKREVRMMVGGWPGYHTHFTPIAMPKVPS